MRNMKQTLVVLGVFVGIIACEETDITEFSDGLTVEVGKECGWCFGREGMTISEEVSSYAYDNACSDSLDIEERFFVTPSADWEAINEYLQKGVFETLDLQSCGVCADGCDISITVTDINDKYKISFESLEDIEDEATRNFAEKLASRLDEMNDQN